MTNSIASIVEFTKRHELIRMRAHAPALAAVGLGLRGLAVGLGSWRPGDDEASLLSRADDEMYADKRNAREGVATLRAGGPFVSAA